MNYNHIIKKQTFIITASIIVMAIILVGTSYALFTNTDTSNTQTLTSGTLVVSYSGTTITTVGGTDGNGNLLEVTPLDELTVNQQTPYTIKINNTGTLALKYNIILFTDSINTLPHSYYSYKYKDNGTYTNKAALSTLPKVDPTETNMNSIRYKLTDEPFIVNPGTEATHEIYVWVDAIAADGASEDKIASLKIMVEGEATDEYGDSGVSIVETVQNIVSGESTSSTDVIDQGNGNTLAYDGTNDNNLRYVGSNPANYVQYNNELWRIIGVMNNIETEGGATQSLVKIRRVESLGSYVWDSSYGPGTYWWGTTIGINNGYGVNQWGNSGSYAGAYLMQELNNDYLGNITIGTDGNWFTGINEEKNTAKPNSTISARALNMIESVKWNLGSPNNNNGTALEYDNSLLKAQFIYSQERSNNTGKLCSSGDYCNDDVTRTPTWTGKVALIYPSDYLYATSGGNTTNRNTCLDTQQINWNNSSVYDCKNNDWLLDSSDWQKTISPFAKTDDATFIFVVDQVGAIYEGYVSYPTKIYPTLYLKSSVFVTGGTGTQADPYTLGI